MTAVVPTGQMNAQPSDYFNTIRRQWPVIVLLAVLGALLAAGSAPRRRRRTRRRPPCCSVPSAGPARPARQRRRRDRDVDRATGRRVPGHRRGREDEARRPGHRGAAPAAHGDGAVDANVLTFAFESTDAEKAAPGADAFAAGVPRLPQVAGAGRGRPGPRQLRAAAGDDPHGAGRGRRGDRDPRRRRRGEPPRSGTRRPVEPSSRPSRRWSPTASTMSPASASRRRDHLTGGRTDRSHGGRELRPRAGRVRHGRPGGPGHRVHPQQPRPPRHERRFGQSAPRRARRRSDRGSASAPEADTTEGRHEAAALRRTAATIDARLGEHSRTPIVVLAISRATPASDVAGGLADGLARRSTVAVVDAVSASRTATPSAGRTRRTSRRRPRARMATRRRRRASPTTSRGSSKVTTSSWWPRHRSMPIPSPSTCSRSPARSSSRWFGSVIRDGTS